MKHGDLTSKPASLGILYWEGDPDSTREVVRSCKTVMLVSPSGIAHASSGGGETDCGHDATGPECWWRL